MKFSATGDKHGFEKAVEAIIAEERAKQHNVLADRLARAVRMNGVSARAVAPVGESSAHRTREFIAEITPARQLSDLVLPDIVRRAAEQLVEEQQRLMC